MHIRISPSTFCFSTFTALLFTLPTVASAEFTELLHWQSDVARDGFGKIARDAGDLNGDGVDDFVVFVRSSSCCGSASRACLNAYRGLMNRCVQWVPTRPTPWWVKLAFSMFARCPGLFSHASSTLCAVG
jgi:hypothetical protein